MLNKKLYPLMAFAIMFAVPATAAMEVDIIPEEERSVFQRIADFEQERILLQLETEKARLMLDLDRMALEQSRLRADAANFTVRDNEEVRQLENEIRQLERENQRLEREKERLEDRLANAGTTAPQQDARGRQTAAAARGTTREPEDLGGLPIFQKFRLLEIVGVGRQLQATIEDLNTGQRRRVSAGHGIDGYQIQSISLDDGIVFVKDGVTQNLAMSGRTSETTSTSAPSAPTRLGSSRD
jgi:type IV pilus biogenesis protein PilP